MTRHLIHVGYPKSGSMFLLNWFAQHPQLAFQSGGIAGFGSVYAIARAAAAAQDERVRVSSFEGLSAPRTNAGDDLSVYAPGELSVRARQQHACALLAGLFPNAEILIVTRGFRSVILSTYSQYLRSGGDAPFETLVAHALAMRPDDDHPLVSTEHWNYDQLIDDYRRAFGPENVIVMPYELLEQDSTAFVSAIETRLGLDHFLGATNRVNPALTDVELAWYPRLTRLAARPRSRRLFEIYIRAAFSGRLRKAIRILQHLRPLEPVTAAALPDEVVERFRGCAESLKDSPLHAPYSREYLF